MYYFSYDRSELYNRNQQKSYIAMNIWLIINEIIVWSSLHQVYFKYTFWSALQDTSCKVYFQATVHLKYIFSMLNSLVL